jgi:RNA polymerase sigma factor (sigma-70 family)
MPVDKVARLLLRARAKKLKRRPLKVVSSPEFDSAGAPAAILGAPLTPPRQPAQPEVAPVYLKGVADPSLLTRDDEIALFRRYNFLKLLASQLIADLDVRRPVEGIVSRTESLLADATRVRDRIITANLRLVPAIARKHSVPVGSFPNIISEGNVALMDAVESFDYTRGNRFSTYAGWAITRRFARAVPEERNRVAIVEDTVLDSAAKVEVDFTAAKPAAIIAGVKRALLSLSRRDRVVLERRFGLGANDTPATLAELGALFGVTKERIRQVEAQALERLRRIVERTAPELAPA